MKKTLAIAMTVFMIGGLVSFAAAHQGKGRGWGRGYGQGSCLEDQDQGGRGRGPGACLEEGERRGRGYGPGNCRSERFGQELEGEVDSPDAASALVESLLERRGNPNLKIGKVTESGRDFEVEIVTKDGSLANKLYVEKNTGRIIPFYR